MSDMSHMCPRCQHVAGGGRGSGCRCTLVGCCGGTSIVSAFAELSEAVGDAFDEADARRAKERSEHPCNGTAGWWLVSGIRHEQTVYATSADEALRKSERVGSWEGPDVDFLSVCCPMCGRDREPVSPGKGPAS